MESEMSQATRLTDADLLLMIVTFYGRKASTRDIIDNLKVLGTNVTPNRVNRVLGRFTKDFSGRMESLTANKAMILAGVKAYAMEHYEEGGWDIMVECYSDQENLNVLGESWTVSGSVKKMAKHLGVIADYRADIQGA
jgi:hypothetical protein